MKKFIRQIFSINNKGKKKIITILGIKITFTKFFGIKKEDLRNQIMYKFIGSNNSLVKQDDKILIIAPHPDDEVISCGGFIAKYSKQIDILCINSSGVKYEWNSESAEEIAQIRCNEFYNVMKKSGVNKSFIAKIWGIPPMFEDIKKHIDDYLENFNMKEYDIILVPDRLDGHREHRFVANYLTKHLLKKSGYKNDAKIARYEVWATLENVNYFEDISDVIEKKEELINAYESRIKANYAGKIKGLNFYRGLVAGCEYAEAFNVLCIKKYLNEKDDKSWSKIW